MKSPILAVALGSGLLAQAPSLPTPLSKHHVLDLDSTPIDHLGAAPGVVFRRTVEIRGARWLRLSFDRANLPPGTRLRITGISTSWVQHLDGASLVDYFSRSCFFDGDAIRVELVAGPGTRANRIRISGADAGTGDFAPVTESICGNADNRVPSSDPRQGRLSIGCTGWLCDRDLMLTAGHCLSPSRNQILMFNVPLSSSTGSLTPSHPNDQYPTVAATARWLDAGVGADWGVCRIGRNSNTGRLPGDVQGSWYSLGSVPTSTAGQNIDITGYGVVSAPVSRTWNQVQKRHTGPLFSIAATRLRYQVDTTGGNSGSPVIHLNSNRVIGIHTHAGCTTSSTSANNGTRIDRSDLQAAIAALKSADSVFVPDDVATAGACNVIPFGQSTLSPTWKNQRYQALVTAADLGNPATRTISDLAFSHCSAGVRHFDRIQVRLAQTIRTSLSTTFASNLTANVRTVLDQRSYDWRHAGNTWSRIGLESDYVYSAGLGANLVIEITVEGAVLNTGSPASAGVRTGARERVFAVGWTGAPPAAGTADTSSAAKVEVVFNAADLQVFGVGCAGSNSLIPTLTMTGTGRIGTSYTLDLAGAPSNANAFLSVGLRSLFDPPLDLALIGAPRCNMYFLNDITAGVRSSRTGAVQMTLPVPVGTPLRQRVYFQFFPLDPRANPAGLTSSNYGRVLTGN